MVTIPIDAGPDDIAKAIARRFDNLNLQLVWYDHVYVSRDHDSFYYRFADTKRKYELYVALIYKRQLLRVYYELRKEGKTIRRSDISYKPKK